VIAVRRRGLSDAQKLALALYDNRTAELAEWDAEPLGQDAAAGLLTPFFNPGELRALLKTGSPAADRVTVKEIDTATVHDKFWIAVEGPLPAQAEALRRLRAVMSEIPGLTVELGTIPAETWEPPK
jgi:delta 1-pyrroline-5-carboxylate dehydrogenase